MQNYEIIFYLIIVTEFSFSMKFIYLFIRKDSFIKKRNKNNQDSGGLELEERERKQKIKDAVDQTIQENKL